MKKKYISIILLIIPLLFSCFLSCSKDSDDIIDSEQTQDNDNEDTDLYSLSDMSGYYVDSEAWNNCQRRINELGNSSYFKETYLDDEILSEGVYGFYIPTTGRAYELFFEPTTTLYSNNQAAGNKIVHTWNAVNDIKVYFEQTIGSSYSSPCTIVGNIIIVAGIKHTIISSSSFKTNDGCIYTKIKL